MRIFQILPTVSFGDAVGNDTIALKKVISQMGYQTEIYAENIDVRLPKKTALPISKLTRVNKDDIIIYHKSTGTRMSFTLDKWDCHRMMIYHNITPPSFFREYSMKSTELSELGIKGMKYLSDKIEYCMADSDFNKNDLSEAGYSCPVDVRPILIPFDDYKKAPDEAIIKKYCDGYVNIIFVGRIAPNKKQEDVIRAFNYYKKHINSRSRLVFVGSYSGMESYYDRLCRYVDALGLEDVVFTGHISFSGILAWYKAADIFLCMSEHEGFCVPLVEAMFFDVPVIAYDCCAIPYTMNGSGAVIDTKEPAAVAMLMDRIINDSSLRESIIASQRKRLEDFSYEKVRSVFEGQLSAYIEKIRS
ncbi:MAG: glycosyltransferase family 4 protein [Ruminococcus sp.]|nr:glycosyltransferase family 4 protein [Ruminococcus sp.]